MEIKLYKSHIRVRITPLQICQSDVGRYCECLQYYHVNIYDNYILYGMHVYIMYWYNIQTGNKEGMENKVLKPVLGP